MKPWILLLLPVTAGCGGEPARRASDAPWFVDVTRRLGVEFTHEMGARLDYFMPEIMGAGVALFDYDDDGDLDLYLINGAASPGVEPIEPAPRNRLYRQQNDGSFVDVTDDSGLGDTGFGMGVAVGDHDNDGWVDVYVTNYGANVLYRNQGDGTFRDVTARAGVGDPAWGTSAAFLDYDADGWLDLYVANYLTLTPGARCRTPTGRQDYCDVGRFPGASDRLYRNRGDGTFEDASESSGIGPARMKGLGVVAADLTGDGRADLYVANDNQQNLLWVNHGDGTFTDGAVLTGVAYNAAAAVEASMGIVCDDLDGDAELDLFVTHIGGQTHTLYRGEAGRFQDRTGAAGIAGPTSGDTGFGTAAVDADHDGDLDLLIANGHVFRQAPQPGSRLGPFWARYAQAGVLLENDGAGRFNDISGLSQRFGLEPRVGRGLAVGDIDRDGDLDFVVTACGGQARVFANEAPKAGHWLVVRARDERLRRDVAGAHVTLVAGARRWVRRADPAYGYLTSHDPGAHFGLGDVARVDAIEVIWPGGATETFPGGAVDRYVTLRHGEGDAP